MTARVLRHLSSTMQQSQHWFAQQSCCNCLTGQCCAVLAKWNALSDKCRHHCWAIYQTLQMDQLHCKQLGSTTDQLHDEFVMADVWLSGSWWCTWHLPQNAF